MVPGAVMYWLNDDTIDNELCVKPIRRFSMMTSVHRECYSGLHISVTFNSNGLFFFFMSLVARTLLSTLLIHYIYTT